MLKIININKVHLKYTTYFYLKLVSIHTNISILEINKLTLRVKKIEKILRMRESEK